MKEEKIKEAFSKIKQDVENLRKEISDIKNTKNHEKEIIVAASGYFDPIHRGHIEYLKKSKELGDKLIVIVNSDEQTINKKGYVFMSQPDRMSVVKSLEFVDEVMSSIDRDKSVCESLKFLNPDIFAKGGDRTKKEIPEAKICKDCGIKIIDGLGKKIQSSSELIRKLKPDKKQVKQK
jgi:cytidyltransferase-like protein